MYVPPGGTSVKLSRCARLLSLLTSINALLAHVKLDTIPFLAKIPSLKRMHKFLARFLVQDVS